MVERDPFGSLGELALSREHSLSWQERTRVTCWILMPNYFKWRKRMYDELLDPSRSLSVCFAQSLGFGWTFHFQGHGHCSLFFVTHIRRNKWTLTVIESKRKNSERSLYLEYVRRRYSILKVFLLLFVSLPIRKPLWWFFREQIVARNDSRYPARDRHPQKIQGLIELMEMLAFNKCPSSSTPRSVPWCVHLYRDHGSGRVSSNTTTSSAHRII